MGKTLDRRAADPDIAPTWKLHDAFETYGVKNWGKGYFGINKLGHVTVLGEEPEGFLDRGRRRVVELRRDHRPAPSASVPADPPVGPSAPAVPTWCSTAWDRALPLPKRCRSCSRSATATSTRPSAELPLSVRVPASEAMVLAEPSVTATAFESVPERVQRIATNADTLGVPGLRVVSGRAPACLAEADPPDVIFVGGGITTGGLLDACWAALPLGGRLVANTVTLEGERAVVAARAQYSGTLARFDVAHAGAVGGFTAWRPQMTVVQWATHKETT